jgi:hypothetical protein
VPPDWVALSLFPRTTRGIRQGEFSAMTGKEFRVLLAESAPGEAANGLRALSPGPDSTLELSIVPTLPTPVATIELAAPGAMFLDLSPGEAQKRGPRSASKFL